MNNIEILEDLTKHIRFNEPLHYGIGLYIQAMENLIKENKELKKENEKNKKLENKIKEILKKDRDCMSLGYYSVYIGLIDDIQELLYEE